MSSEYFMRPPVSETVRIHTLIILTLMQGVGGTISNALSLSYFLTKYRETLASKLMILLNSIDLLVCLSSSVMGTGFVLSLAGFKIKELVLYPAYWFQFLVAATAFATCLLSVTRTISLVSPFYKIKKKTLVSATAIYGMMLIFSRFVLPIINPIAADIYLIVEMTLIILIVIISLIISVVKLQSGGNNPANSDPARRHATITILIISGFFCAVNIAYVLSIFMANIILKPKSLDEFLNILMTLVFSTYVGIPFNSTINPIIYFIRKQEIRDYAKSTLFGRCCYHCCCNGRARGGNHQNRLQNAVIL